MGLTDPVTAMYVYAVRILLSIYGGRGRQVEISLLYRTFPLTLVKGLGVSSIGPKKMDIVEREV
jgi:hypothetical protein